VAFYKGYILQIDYHFFSPLLRYIPEKLHRLPCYFGM
jgi:hypothetical protein